MNVSPVLMLSIGASFGLLYGLIITVGWAITRKNRKSFHDAVGFSSVDLIDLDSFKILGTKTKIVSLENNFFVTNNKNLNPADFNCYVVASESAKFPELHQGDLIFVEPSTNSIKFAFKIPDLNDFR